MNRTKKQKFLQSLRKLPLGWLLSFVIKLGWAAVFGGLMLLAIIVTRYVELPWLARADWLFLWAVAVQLVLLLTKLEKPHEVITIFVFHLVGLGMEIFKTSNTIGSWQYLSVGFFHAGNVPLYSGFMYASVGSFIARAWRVLDLKYTNSPRKLHSLLLAVAIYINFFTHHYIFDFRWLLLALMALLYWRCDIHYRINQRQHHMPFLLSAFLSAFFIWVAENIGTFTQSWLYPSQRQHWHVVSLQKLSAWLLLMYISFVLIDILHYLRQKRLAERQQKC